MKFQLVNPNAVLRDPQTRRPVSAEPFEIAETDPRISFYVRQWKAGDLKRLDEPATPTGNEPIKPLTTR